MSYALQAIIGDASLLNAHCPATVVVVGLPQGKAMIPICGELLEQTEIPFLPLTDGGDYELCDSLIEFVVPLVGQGKFVYVEAEFFGGDGTQACVTWDVKGARSKPLVDSRAINEALKLLGVQVGSFHDEFDALGLGKHRDTEGWLTEMKVQGSSNIYVGKIGSRSLPDKSGFDP